MKKSVLISIEGVQGAGKTTVVAELHRRAKAHGYSVTTTNFEPSTIFISKLRALIVSDEASNDGYVEALLSCALRREFFLKVIDPQLKAGMSIIAERFTDTTRAFAQARMLDGVSVQTLAKIICDGCEPRLTILLDIDPRIALIRIPIEARHRLEREPTRFHERLREAYLLLARTYTDRIRIVDAALPEERVLDACWQLVQPLLQASPTPE